MATASIAIVCLICIPCNIRRIPLSVFQSHRIAEAHWDGHCPLLAEEQQAFFLKNVVKMGDDDLVSAMEDLGTNTSTTNIKQ